MTKLDYLGMVLAVAVLALAIVAVNVFTASHPGNGIPGIHKVK